jgi:hypothetical protein
MAGICYAKWKNGDNDSGQQQEPPVVLRANKHCIPYKES